MVTTFVVQTSQALQKDYSRVSASLLTELVALQRAALTSGNISNIDKSPLTLDGQYSPSQADIWVNGLWFTSLALSLSAALMAGLIKQWIQHYVSSVSGTPKHRTCVRQFRYAGIEKWRLHLIIELLPVLMNTALLLFFAGMVLFLHALKESMAWAIAAIASVAYLAYLCSSLLPLLYPDCPFNTSLSYTLTFLVAMLGRITRWHSFFRSGLVRIDVDDKYNNNDDDYTQLRGTKESEETRRVSNRLALDAITNIVGRSSNPTVHNVALQSLSGQLAKSADPLPPDLTFPLEKLFMSCFELIAEGGQRKYTLKSGFGSVAERLSRALVNVSSTLQAKTYSCLLEFLRSISLEFDPESQDVYNFNIESFYCRVALLIHFEGFSSNDPLQPFSRAANSCMRYIIGVEDSLPDSLRNYPWIHKQITSYARSFRIEQLWTVEERSEHLLILATRLTPWESPNLKDEVILRCLSNYYCSASRYSRLAYVS